MISNDIACLEHATGWRQLVRLYSAVCSNVNGGKQNSGQHGEVLLLAMPRERCY